MTNLREMLDDVVAEVGKGGKLRGIEQAALAHSYAAGVVDGFKVTLELLLGIDTDGGVPYRGPLPEELRVWAQSALDAIPSEG